jgi:hypothetical protein
MIMRGYDQHEISAFFLSNFEPSEWAAKRGGFIYQTLQDSGFMTSRAGRGIMERVMLSSLVRIEEATHENIPLLTHEDAALSNEERLVKAICKLISETPPSSGMVELCQMVIKHCFPMVLLSAIDQMSTYVMDTFVVDADTGLVIGI